MTRAKHQPVAACASCGAPTPDAALCSTCLSGVETDLGDVAALASEAQRVFVSDTRDQGTDQEPLLRSRVRRKVVAVRVRDGAPFCVVDPRTRGPVLELEAMPPGSFGRAPSTRWDADHGLGREIDATVARQTATAKREGGRSSSTPLPFNDRAALVAQRAHNALGTWVRDLHDGDEPMPRDDLVAMSAWLLSRLRRIAQHPAAREIEHEVHRVVADLRRAVDRPADRMFMGPCDTDGCLEEHLLVDDDGRSRTVRRPTELYAEPTAETVRCHRCDAEYDIAERRAWLLAAAEDQLAHAELIGRAAPALGVDITPSMVRNYADRKRIVAHGTDQHGRPLYRIGEVIAVVQDVLTKRAEQASERTRKAESRRSA